MEEIICPYCKSETIHDGEDIYEDLITELQCPECDKYFEVEVEIEKSYHSYKMDQPEEKPEEILDHEGQTFFSFFEN